MSLKKAEKLKKLAKKKKRIFPTPPKIHYLKVLP